MRAAVLLLGSLIACNSEADSDDNALVPTACLTALEPDLFDRFGSSVALSDDGTTLAIGAPGGPTEFGDNESTDRAGAVYVFTRTETSWILEWYLEASSADASDRLGSSVALSADGSTLAVSAPLEDSAATGVGGDRANNAAPSSGAVYIFARDAMGWTDQAYVKASNTEANDAFGNKLALSDDGATLAVGALEHSAAVGIDGNQSDNTALGAGAVYVFARTGSSWSQQAYIKASNTDAGDGFSLWTLALSGDGSTLAVGSDNERSAATGINGDQADNSTPGAGAVYVFTRAGSSWTQHSYLKASNTDRGDFFGQGVALSGDGATLAVGAIGERSAALGVNGDQTNNSIVLAGATYVFSRTDSSWIQEAYIKASRREASEWFGRIVALSNDGSVLAVGHRRGVDVLIRASDTWSLTSRASLGEPRLSGALSGDGTALAIGGRRSSTVSPCVDHGFDGTPGAVYTLSPLAPR